MFRRRAAEQAPARASVRPSGRAPAVIPTPSPEAARNVVCAYMRIPLPAAVQSLFL
ncbi:hypothetical protein [uncultured Pseudoflavonifractor sp.]|uniref:hypothetical protein n=1 Tax=uncultured Pseudoflavonifractor sp. TaxID=1221379 RepID=UPI0025E211FD|nr:hypothetical protein [uncultured Pseudoflavonifractor sp.]